MAQKILGLDIGADSLKATVVEAKLRSVEIIQCVTQPVPSSEEIARLPRPDGFVPQEPAEDFPTESEDKTEESGESPDGGRDGEEPNTPPAFAYALDQLMKRPGLEFDDVVISMPGHWASSRVLDFPFSSRAKIVQALPIAIEDEVPFDLDDMLTAHQIYPQRKAGAKVLASLVKREDFRRYLHDVQRAGVDPKAAHLTTAALAVTVKNAMPERLGVFAVVDLGKTATNVVVFEGGRLVHTRSLPTGGEDVTARLAKSLGVPPDKAEQLKTQVGRIFAEGEDKPDDERLAKLADALVDAHRPLLGRLRQTVRGMEKDGGFAIDTVYTTGGGFRLPGLAEHVQGELGIAVEPLRAFHPDMPSLVENTAEKSGAFAVSLGLALADATSTRLRAPNFRTGEFAYHKVTQEVQGSLKGLAVMAGILLALFIVLVIQSRSVESTRAQAIDQQIRQIYLETFKQQPPGGGDVVAAFNSQVEQVKAKHQVLGFLGDGDLRALDVLKAMSDSVPKELVIDIKQFDLRQDFAKLEAVTDTYQTVNKIETELRRSPIFTSVNREDAKKTPDDKIRFKLTLRLVEDEKGKAGVATLFGAGGAKKDTVPMGGAGGGQ
ncbi:MAG: type II secretion system protein GspL [Deltaproteobacteria bacterium]|nr:type II secretion system protein GspL [Deltaproteobacteria bacterium]